MDPFAAPLFRLDIRGIDRMALLLECHVIGTDGGNAVPLGAVLDVQDIGFVRQEGKAVCAGDLDVISSGG